MNHVVEKIRTDELPIYIGYSESKSQIRVVVVNAKTESLARNKDFQDKVDSAIDMADSHLLYIDFSSLDENIKTCTPIHEIPCIRENTYIYRYHNGNRLAIVEFDRPVGEEVKTIAVQCMAGKPTHLSRNEVLNLDELIQEATEQAIKSGKPEAIARKIAEGKVSSQLKEFVFLEQTMYNENITVSKLTERLKVNIINFHLFP